MRSQKRLTIEAVEASRVALEADPAMQSWS
jgi:hypothetical protein